MTASVISFPKSRHNPRGNVSNLHGCRVYPFPEHSPELRADAIDRSAADVLAKSAVLADTAFALLVAWQQYIASFRPRV